MQQAALSEFPFVDTLPKREKSKLRKAWDLITDFTALTKQHGALIPVVGVIGALGISKQRVHFLIGEGRFETVEFHGHYYITEKSLVDFAKSERKNGRPVKAENMSAADCVRSARELVNTSK